jgi:hypothetical protein
VGESETKDPEIKHTNKDISGTWMKTNKHSWENRFAVGKAKVPEVSALINNTNSR